VGNLNEAEQRELEELVERVIGAGFFARRRGKQAAQVGIDVLARTASANDAVELLQLRFAKSERGRFVMGACLPSCSGRRIGRGCGRP